MWNFNHFNSMWRTAKVLPLSHRGAPRERQQKTRRAICGFSIEQCCQPRRSSHLSSFSIFNGAISDSLFKASLVLEKYLSIELKKRLHVIKRGAKSLTPAPGGNRTHFPGYVSIVLYPMSYRGSEWNL